MAYASSTDLVARFDENTIRDLASDSGHQVTDLTCPVVTAALDDASGQIDSALFNGKAYDADDLAALTGNSLALLKRICCELAMCFLMGRRPEKYGEDSIREMYERADGFLERIRQGERIFDSTAHLGASVTDVDGPTTVKYTDMNLIPDRTRHFYPHRGTRLPLSRG